MISPPPDSGTSVGTTESYDLFVSHADADRAWVEGYLLDALAAAGLRCASETAFALGAPRVLEFERAIKESRRTLLVISDAYLVDGFGQFVDLLSQSYGLETGTWNVIPLILKPVELPARLAMLEALDATTPDAWPSVVARLLTDARRPIPDKAPRPPCPYPGMVPFQEADSERFFGRQAEAAEMLERLRLHPFLTVIGPSGSGKSSLVFAGLVPLLRRSSLFGAGDWLVKQLRPGAAPLAALSDALGSDLDDVGRAVASVLESVPGARRLLLIVDQFEELFTVARRDAARFQATIGALADVPNCFVVLTVRADFYGDVMASPLWPAIQGHRFEVVPLDEAGLRAAIVRPAEDVGVFIEAALVERIVADAAGEPGILPLGQEALVLLWERLERRFLPLRAYEALVLTRGQYGPAAQGQRTGLQVAMARRADATLAALSVEQQAIARRVFLRLIQFGEGRADTRRQQTVAALSATGDDPAEFDATLRRLIDSRLLTASGDAHSANRTVDIAHEALISGWPTLQSWLNERREAEQHRRRLQEKADEWLRLGSGAGGLLDAIELHEAERWIASAAATDLGVDEGLRQLVAASQAELARQSAEARRARRIRRIAFAATALSVIVALGIGLWSARRDAAAQRRQTEQQAAAAATANALLQRADAAAATAEAERSRAEQQSRIALARQLATQGESEFDLRPGVGMLLGVEALRVSLDSGEPAIAAVEEALRRMLDRLGGYGLSGHVDGVAEAIFSPDNRWLVTVDDAGTAYLWQLGPRDATASQAVLGSNFSLFGASQDGRWLYALESASAVRFWDLSADDPAAATVAVRGDGLLQQLIASPDGRWLAALPDMSVLDAEETPPGEATPMLIVDLEANNPERASYRLGTGGDPVMAFTVSPDGRWSIASGAGGALYSWNLSNLASSPSPDVMRRGDDSIERLQVSADSRWLAVRGSGGATKLWRITETGIEPEPILTLADVEVSAFQFSPDARWLVTARADGRIQLWDLSGDGTLQSPVELALPEHVAVSLTVSADGRWLITGSIARDEYGSWAWDDDLAAETIDVWRLEPSGISAAPALNLESINSWTLSPDNRWLVARTWNETKPGNTKLQIVDLSSAAPETVALDTVASDFPIRISVNSRWLVAEDDDNKYAVWDLSAAQIAESKRELQTGTSWNSKLVTSPDGRWLVGIGDDTTARLWDLAAARPGASTRFLQGTNELFSAVAFSLDRRWLLTNDETHTQLWDLAPFSAASPITLPVKPDVLPTNPFSPDGSWLAIPEQRTLALWDLRSQVLGTESTRQLQHADGDVVTMGFSPDGRWLAAAGAETISVWDLSSADPAAGMVRLTGHAKPVFSLMFSADGRYLWSGGDDGTARRWDLTAADPSTAPLVVRVGETSVGIVRATERWLLLNHFPVDVSATEDLAVTPGGWPRSLWDLRGTEPRQVIGTDPGAELQLMAVSGDGRWLLGMEVEEPILFDLTGVEPTQVALSRAGTRIVSSAQFSPDSRWLIGEGESLYLWSLSQVAAGAEPVRLDASFDPIMSPDGRWLIATRQGGLDIWDMHTIRSGVHGVQLPGASWNSVVSPDSRVLTVSIAGNGIQIVPLDVRELLSLACAAVGRNLTPAEWQQFMPAEQPYRATCPDLPNNSAQQ